MDFICLHDKKEIEHFLRKDVYLQIYSIGDLDDFFWPYTTWYGSRSDGKIEAATLVYAGLPLPTLLALSGEHAAMAKLLSSILHLLPNQFYAHLSPGLEAVFAKTHDLEPYGEHDKMALLDTARIPNTECSGAVRLSQFDLADIQALYQKSYPENWFDPRMLDTGRYFGIKEGRRLISIAGVHVYSPQYKVAALGNIATVPRHRNEGYGTRVTATLCKSLLKEGMRIGLNVKSDNAAAKACYERLGFKIVAVYGEFMAQKKK